MTQISIEYKRIKERAFELGLDSIGLSDCSVLEEGKKRLSKWQARGFVADMGFMKRDAQLLSSPALLFPKARSVVIFAIPYDRSPLPPTREGFGRVARYAWGADYHLVLKTLIEKLVARLSFELGRNFEYRIFTDAVPLLERALAQRAGLGFFGRNSMLIRKKMGSFFYIAELFSELEIYGSEEPSHDQSCPPCTRCMEACPTDAIVEEQILDARRCISYLTIEKKGPLNATEQSGIGEWVFGCDLCQDCCPFNAASLKAGLKPKIPELGQMNQQRAFLDLNELLSIRDTATFKKRFFGTAILRSKREGLLRNAAAVAANTKSGSVSAMLRRTFKEDNSAMLRAAALEALSRLRQNGIGLSSRTLRNLVNQGLMDPDPLVRKAALSAAK